MCHIYLAQPGFVQRFKKTNTNFPPNTLAQQGHVHPVFPTFQCSTVGASINRVQGYCLNVASYCAQERSSFRPVLIC